MTDIPIWIRQIIDRPDVYESFITDVQERAKRASQDCSAHVANDNMNVARIAAARVQVWTDLYLLVKKTRDEELSQIQKGGILDA